MLSLVMNHIATKSFNFHPSKAAIIIILSRMMTQRPTEHKDWSSKGHSQDLNTDLFDVITLYCVRMCH